MWRALGNVNGARTRISGSLERSQKNNQVCLKIGVSPGFWIPQEHLVPASEPHRAEFTYHSILQSTVKSETSQMTVLEFTVRNHFILTQMQSLRETKYRVVHSV